MNQDMKRSSLLWQLIVIIAVDNLENLYIYSTLYDLNMHNLSSKIQLYVYNVNQQCHSKVFKE